MDFHEMDFDEMDFHEMDFHQELYGIWYGAQPSQPPLQPFPCPSNPTYDDQEAAYQTFTVGPVQVLTNEFPPFRLEQQQQQQKQQQKEAFKTDIKEETPKEPAEAPAPTQQYQELTVCYVCHDVTPLKGFPKHMMEAHFGLNCYAPGCHATFTTESDLKLHLEYHSAPEYVGPNLGYRCCWPNCSRTFNHRGEIRLHHLKHNVGEKIVCEMRARNMTKAPVIRVPVPEGIPTPLCSSDSGGCGFKSADVKIDNSRKLELSYILNPVTEE
ncbi:hypothetical protein F5X96DRAFT_669065 [Biscogniauxia mediterranea]|nr:hypothetical protein F5X96DRAFT_669065 [Biscogniauxia mediterranea]